MQTFLPYSNFEQTAAVLDRQRLGKQRVEALQILQVLSGQTSAWSKHPAVLMWKDSEWWLAQYGATICQEWIKRGYKDNCLPRFLTIQNTLTKQNRLAFAPLWLVDPNFHRSHQSNLVRKNPNHYRQFFPDVPDDLPYIWPI